MDEIETGVLPAGHPFARIGTGSRTVLYIPGLSFTAEPSNVSTIRRMWKAWRLLTVHANLSDVVAA